MWDLKKIRLFKVSQCWRNIDINKEKEKIDRNAQKGRGDIKHLFFCLIPGNSFPILPLSYYSFTADQWPFLVYPTSVMVVLMPLTFLIFEYTCSRSFGDGPDILTIMS